MKQHLKLIWVGEKKTKILSGKKKESTDCEGTSRKQTSVKAISLLRYDKQNCKHNHYICICSEKILEFKIMLIYQFPHETTVPKSPQWQFSVWSLPGYLLRITEPHKCGTFTQIKQ